MPCVALCLDMPVVCMQYIGLRNAKPEIYYCLEEENQILGRGIILNRFDDIYFSGKKNKRLVRVFGKEGSVFLIKRLSLNPALLPSSSQFLSSFLSVLMCHVLKIIFLKKFKISSR